MPPFLGAKAMGLGFSSACLSDEWALFNNVAGLAKVDRITGAFTCEARPSFTPYNRMGIAFSLPIGFGVVSSGAYKFGDQLYNEQILTAGFSNSFGLASLGVKVNYVQYHTEMYGNARALTISAGGIAEITRRFSVGAHIVNINQPQLSKMSEETIPTILVLGLAFRPSNTIYITTEVEKDLEYELKLKSGLSWDVNKKFTVRTGFNLNPQAGFAGLGFRTKFFQLDYAFQYNVTIGSSHQATVAYQFKTK
jgi:hypothetical protein